METKKNDWKRPEDIVTFRTSNPKEMLDKYLASPVVKSWTEDFTDEDTGEIVSIERNQLYFSRGMCLTKERIQEVIFHIQAGDFEDVEVSDILFDTERFIVPRLIPWEVTFVWGGTQRKMYLTRAQSIEQAIKITADYASIHLKEHGVYSVRKVQVGKYKVIEDNSAEDTSGDTEKQYYVTTAELWLHDNIDDSMEKEVYSYVVSAEEVGEAKKRTSEYIAEEFKKELAEQRNNTFAVTKAIPYTANAIIPLEYCKLYKVNTDA